MANPTEIAEAFLLVVKRIAKWLTFGMIGLVALVGLIWGGVVLYQYVTHDLPASEVKATVVFDKGTCPNESHPMAIKITNGSARVVMHARVYLNAFLPGRSTNFADYKAYESDLIIAPGRTGTLCWLPVMSPSAPKDLKWQNLYWGVSTVSLTFGD
jgi:hypothetical protein